MTLVTLANETYMRLEFNTQHQLYMRKYGLDKVDVDILASTLDPIMDLVNIKSTDTILDAGAYIGRSARYLFHRGCAHVVSVEAYANNVHILEKNASDERILLKKDSSQLHTVIGGALWDSHDNEYGRVYLNNGSKSHTTMTTYRLEHSDDIAWTNSIPLHQVLTEFTPNVGIFTVNGTEFDFLTDNELKNRLSVFREFIIIYHIRNQQHMKEFAKHDEYIREVLLYRHIVEPDLNPLKTTRSGEFLITIPVLYRKMRTNVLQSGSRFDKLHEQSFATFDDMALRNARLAELKRGIEEGTGTNLTIS